jgi:glycosyltransferase involved in cell wall biosynthesis
VLVAPADAQELADNLQHLIEDPALRKQLGVAGRVRVINDYDLKNNSQALGDLFKSLELSEG